MAAGDARARAHLRNHRRVLRLHHRHLRRFLRFPQPAGAGPRADRRRRRPDSVRWPARCCARSSRRLAERIRFHIPDEKEKRHGQAIAAASLPATSHIRRIKCNFINPTADFFVPDGAAPDAALARTTHLCISAHQDDIEIMAYHGVAECFGRQGPLVHRRGGDQRRGQPALRHLRRLHRRRDAEGARCVEQRKAAFVGEYACQIQLGFTSARSEGRRAKPAVVEDLAADSARRQAGSASICTTWPTSTTRTSSVTLRAIAALRAVPRREHAEESVRLRSVARPGLAAGRRQAGAAGLGALQHRRRAGGRVRFAGDAAASATTWRPPAGAWRTPPTTPRTAPTRRARSTSPWT